MTAHPKAWKPPADLIDLAEDFCEAAYRLHTDTLAGVTDTVGQCLVCGLWEHHTPGCVFVAMQDWLDALASAEEDSE